MLTFYSPLSPNCKYFFNVVVGFKFSRPSIAPGPPDGLQRKLSDKKSERFFVSHVWRALLKFNRMLTEAPELDPFRESVHKAGCKVSSDWANGAFLFVPLPKEKAEEADWMLDEKHVVIRSENMPTLAEALRLLLKKLKPRLQQVDAASKATDLASIVPSACFSLAFL